MSASSTKPSIPYIGSKLKVITKEGEFCGTLFSVDQESSKIAIHSVKSLVSHEILDFVIFDSKDIQELSVIDQDSRIFPPLLVNQHHRHAGY